MLDELSLAFLDTLQIRDPAWLISLRSFAHSMCDPAGDGVDKMKRNEPTARRDHHACEPVHRLDACPVRGTPARTDTGSDADSPRTVSASPATNPAAASPRSTHPSGHASGSHGVQLDRLGHGEKSDPDHLRWRDTLITSRKHRDLPALRRENS